MASIRSSGGTPLLVCPDAEPDEIKRIAELAHGFMFTGGDDIRPKHYNEVSGEHINPLPHKRERTDLHLIRQALDMNKPILGICCGMQLLNVAKGGTLHQDISSEFPESLQHKQKKSEKSSLMHQVNIDKNSLLFDVFKQGAIEVNTFHHQAVKTPGNNLTVTAKSPDGIIEGVEDTSKTFCVGVQWHPERMPESDESKKLFRYFIAKCKT